MTGPRWVASRAGGGRGVDGEGPGVETPLHVFVCAGVEEAALILVVEAGGEVEEVELGARAEGEVGRTVGLAVEEERDVAVVRHAGGWLRSRGRRRDGRFVASCDDPARGVGSASDGRGGGRADAERVIHAVALVPVGNANAAAHRRVAVGKWVGPRRGGGGGVGDDRGGEVGGVEGVGRVVRGVVVVGKAEVVGGVEAVGDVDVLVGDVEVVRGVRSSEREGDAVHDGEDEAVEAARERAEVEIALECGQGNAGPGVGEDVVTDGTLA
mmetsp:Transcript_6971/g.21245  ORF Transcript_6971/g.21245 Transcript_6971/m.21245 type:complete len:269 (-) Transcript_6971:95-901(-)